MPPFRSSAAQSIENVAPDDGKEIKIATVTTAVRAELERVVTDMLKHAQAGTMSHANSVMMLNSSAYADPQRFDAELEKLFRRVPLMVALSAELPEAGAFKTMEVAGVPLLIVRGRDGTARAMLNACSHRGAFVTAGCGRQPRFSCPFHGWTFDLQGKLIGIASSEDFGDLDRAGNGLRSFPTYERAGLIWTVLDPESRIDIAAFTGTFADQLETFDLGSWHLVDTRVLRGANWKLAFDAHIDWYHIPVLHRESFGPQVTNRALYDYYGPHLRMTRPQAENPPPPAEADPFKLQGPVSDWPVEALMGGGWIMFPNVSMYTVYPRARRMLNINQVLPGERVDDSLTVQMIWSERALDEETREAGMILANKIETVVSTEDLPTSQRQQQTLGTGLLPQVHFGRNEGGNQNFHRWIQRVLDADGAELWLLFNGREARRSVAS